MNVYESKLEKLQAFCEERKEALKCDIREELKKLQEIADDIIGKLKSNTTASPGVLKPLKKRKLNQIAEEDDGSTSSKKPRSSGFKDLLVPNPRETFTVTSSSTPKAHSAEPEEEPVQEKEAEVSIRPKRNASQKAVAMNSKLLNEKLSQKMRRPSRGKETLTSSTLTILETTSSSKPSIAAASTQETLDNLVAIVSRKNGFKKQLEPMDQQDVVMEEDKENQPLQMNVEEMMTNPAVNTAETCYSEDGLEAETGQLTYSEDGLEAETGQLTYFVTLQIKEELITRSSVRVTRGMQSILSTSSIKQNMEDLQIMPPPSKPMPRQKKLTKTRNTPSKKNRDRSQVEYDSEDEPTPTTRQSRRNQQNQDISVRSTRSTRASTRNKTLDSSSETLPVAEVTKSKRARKVKAAQNDTIPADDSKLIENQTVCEGDEEGKESEPKKRAGRGRRAPAKFTSPPPPLPPPKKVGKSKKADKENKQEDMEECPVQSSEITSDSIMADSVPAAGETSPGGRTPEGSRRRTRSSTGKKEDDQTFVVQKETVPSEKLPSPAIPASKKVAILNETVTFTPPKVNDVTVTLPKDITPVQTSKPGKRRSEECIVKPSQESDVCDSVERKPSRVNDVTVTLSSKDENTFKVPAMDQTIIIQKGLDTREFDPDASILTDDLSEVEQTPPQPQPAQKNFISKITSNIMKKCKDMITTCESPVKKRVQEFERLASGATTTVLESPAHDAPDNLNAPSRVTRTKTRAMAAKQNSQENKEASSEEALSSEAAASKKETRSKIATPLANRLNKPPTKQISSAVKQAHQNIMVNMESFLPVAAPPPPIPKPGPPVRTESADALKKKDALLLAMTEEKRRKREEKSRAAVLAREARDKQKKLQYERAEREKEERSRLMQAEKEERHREEAIKKRQAQERKAAETEERRKAEEEARMRRLREQEAEARKLQEIRLKEQLEAERSRKKLMQEEKELAAARKLQAEQKSQPALAKLLGSKKPVVNGEQKPAFKTLETLNTDDETDEETTTVKKPVPQWSKRSHRNQVIKIMSHIKPSVIDTFYYKSVCNPIIHDIFPQMDRRRFVRTSSAVWKTPPRFSMMPKEDVA